jgi:hypothetical protein
VYYDKAVAKSGAKAKEVIRKKPKLSEAGLQRILRKTDFTPGCPN